MLLTITVLVSGLFPGGELPAPVDSALTASLDSIGISREQLDFDRHWATSVGLLDSTVLSGVQNIEQLPVIMAGYIERSRPLLGDHLPVDNPLDGLLGMLTDASARYEKAMDDAGRERADSLLLVLSMLWADEEHPGDCGEWGAILVSRGLPVPPMIEISADSLLPFLESWNAPEEIPVESLLGLASALALVDWPDEIDVDLGGIDGSVLSFGLSGPVTWVVGGYGSNTYHPDCRFDLIVDAGGNDLYLGGLGGAVGPLGKPVSVIIDISGDDSYISLDSPASQGCGLMGLGALIDLAGNDVYRAGPLAQGAGLMGQGLLADVMGDDIMQADFFSQGAGCVGDGLLLDIAGDDSRRVSCFGQGFGGPAGTGILLDGAGNDCNLAGFRYPHEPLLPDDNRAMSQGFAMGFRPFIAGGIGFMADFGKGNDTYRAEVFGQGSAYYYGLGMLFDEDGQDSYLAAQYSQGSGIHLAAGCLWDGGGDDLYFSRNGPAQGSAHDLSTGFLLDAEGNDWYCSDGGQALSLNNSAALFIDLSGSDTYAVRGGGQGNARWGRGSSGTAVFLDLADRDLYLGEGGDSTGWHSDYGTGIDLSVVTEAPPVSQDDIGYPETLLLDSLFSVASEWGVSGNRDRVLAHREELSARGEEAVAWILENHLDSWSGLEIRAIEKAVKDNSEAASGMLLVLLASDSLSTRELSNTIHLLGEIGSEEARVPLEAILASEDSSFTAGRTAGTIRALGKIGSSESLDILFCFAGHRHERVRREVAVALGAISDPGAVPFLEELTADESIAVRSAAEASLKKIKDAEREPETD